MKTFRTELKELYLDWYNNYLTVGKFAEHHGMQEKDMDKILDLGKKFVFYDADNQGLSLSDIEYSDNESYCNDSINSDEEFFYANHYGEKREMSTADKLSTIHLNETLKKVEARLLELANELEDKEYPITYKIYEDKKPYSIGSYRRDLNNSGRMSLVAYMKENG